MILTLALFLAQSIPATYPDRMEPVLMYGAVDCMALSHAAADSGFRMTGCFFVPYEMTPAQVRRQYLLMLRPPAKHHTRAPQPHHPHKTRTHGSAK